MNSSQINRRSRIHTYCNGQPYIPARGRYAPRVPVEDYVRLTHAVVDLDQIRPTADEFLRKIEREWKIRFYGSSSQRNYTREVRIFLDWFGNDPHNATREDVKDFLEFLVDGERASSTVSHYLSAIRNAFDKMCHRDITLGIVTPRRPKKLPVILSCEEVARLLQAAIRWRDKLLLGMMYATGARNREICRLQWQDIDFARGLVTIRQGKGRVDRHVMLPKTYFPLLRQLSEEAQPTDFLFPGQRPGRYLSPRTAQRIMKRTLRLAGIKKNATPHSLRHSFAAHLFEENADIRDIQRLLGHVKIETTTLYLKVARRRPGELVSPLDRLNPTHPVPHSEFPAPHSLAPSVGRLNIHMRPAPDCKAGERRAQVTLGIQSAGGPVYLTGTVVREMRPGWLNVEVPPLESWDASIRRLTCAQRERLESPEFFELLQSQLSERFYREVFPTPPSG